MLSAEVRSIVYSYLEFQTVAFTCCKLSKKDAQTIHERFKKFGYKTNKVVVKKEFHNKFMIENVVRLVNSLFIYSRKPKGDYQHLLHAIRLYDKPLCLN